MITHEQIKELPRKYAIGKRPLSRILGWGELTYTRLLEGSMPSPQHEEELLRALNEPLTYLMLLDQAHDAGVVSDTSYARSSKAAREYIEEDESAAGAMRMNASARYICMLAKGDITPHALQLLAYFAHGHSLIQLGSPLFETQPIAADDGPVYEAIAAWFTFERIQEAGLVSAEDVDLSLSDAEKKLIRGVVSEYGVYSAARLQELACGGAPWRKARKRAAESGDSPEKAVITAKSMKKYFSKVAK